MSGEDFDDGGLADLLGSDIEGRPELVRRSINTYLDNQSFVCGHVEDFAQLAEQIDVKHTPFQQTSTSLRLHTSHERRELRLPTFIIYSFY